MNLPENNVVSTFQNFCNPTVFIVFILIKTLYCLIWIIVIATWYFIFFSIPSIASIPYSLTQIKHTALYFWTSSQVKFVQQSSVALYFTLSRIKYPYSFLNSYVLWARTSINIWHYLSTTTTHVPSCCLNVPGAPMF